MRWAGVLELRIVPNFKRNLRWYSSEYNMPTGMFLNPKKLRPYRLVPLTIGLGLGFLMLGRVSSHAAGNPHEETYKGKTWRTRIYKTLPWRAVSRTWGSFCNLNVPKWTCNSMVGWYVRRYGVDLSEAERENVEDYNNLADLFRRKLKPGARPIDPRAYLVSPCDGRVLIYGRVEEDGNLEQVKGLNYSLFAFLGFPSWNQSNSEYLESYDEKRMRIPNSLIKRRPDTETSLYYIVIYLAPGDYHRFHSPVNWRISFRRHFWGELLSVNPSVAKWVPGLFTLNERVVYIGEWTYGFFSMTPVGATNVGSIRIYGDEGLTTNRKKHKKGTKDEKLFQEPYFLNKGMDFGEFNLGSTIVLIFELPSYFRISVAKGDRVRVGQSLLL